MNNKGETTFKIIIAILGAILCGLVAVCVCVVIPGRIRERRPQQVTDSSAAEESPQKENPDSEEVRKAGSGSKELDGTGNKNTSDGKTENPDVKTEKTEKDNPGKKTPEEKQDSPKEDDSDEKSSEGKSESREQDNPNDGTSTPGKTDVSEKKNPGGEETPSAKTVLLPQMDTTLYPSYSAVIDALEDEYGTLTVKIYDEPLFQDANSAEYMVETEGLCYLALIDFDNDGTKELLAVAKHENDAQYTVMVYAEEDGNVTQVMSSVKLTDAAWRGNYLCLVSDEDHHFYLNRVQWGGEWRYDEIYGYKNGHFELISISCQEIKSDEQRTDYYIVEKVPEVVDSENLDRRLVSEDVYYTEVPLAIGNSGIEYNYYCLRFPQTDTEISSGSYAELDVDALQASVDQVKKDLSSDSQGNGGSSGNGSGDAEKEAWKQAYIDCIETDPDIDLSDDWCTCGLIYLDYDEIPELIIEYGTEAAGTKIVSYKNGETVSCQFSRNGGIQYLEREGYVYNSAGVMGVMYDEIALLDETGFHDLGRGFRVDENQTFENYTIFNWNEEEVSEEEYYSQLNIFDLSGAQKWNSFSSEYQDNQYSANDMCEYLSEE